MNFEDPTPSPEKEPRFPSLEEIKTEIERLSGSENPEEIRILEDEKGIYLYETVEINEKGEGALYAYRRSEGSPESKPYSDIDVTYFTGNIEERNFFQAKTLSEYNTETGEWTDKNKSWHPITNPNPIDK